jgi:hypothetical protein
MGFCMATKNGVFISHITDEAPIAEALKVYLKRCFGESFPVFVSSDYYSIATGEEWYRAILNAVTQASVVIVLLSRYSIDRRWINFEAGLARGANVRVLPLTIRGLEPGEIGLPLSHLHVRALVHELALDGVVHAITEATGSPLLAMEAAAGFIAQIEQIEATLPVKNILFEPVLQCSANSTPLLRFRLSNSGNRDVDLIEVEVRVPKVILIEPDWVPTEIPNILSSDSLKLGEVEYLIIWEQPFEGALDARRYGSRRMLPRIVSPHWTPRLSDLLTVPIRADLQMIETWSVKHKVVARGLYTEPGVTRLADIPRLP